MGSNAGRVSGVDKVIFEGFCVAFATPGRTIFLCGFVMEKPSSGDGEGMTSSTNGGSHRPPFRCAVGFVEKARRW